MSSGNYFDKSFLPILMALVSVVSILAGMKLQESLEYDGYLDEKSPPEYKAIYEAAEHIQSKYYGEFDKDRFADLVIDEMVDQLDPYSRYFKEETTKKYNRYINGLYRGIGLEFRKYNQRFYVFKVLEGSPAFEQGIKKGSIVKVVDSTLVDGANISLDSLLKISKKEVGESIYLEILDTENELEKSFNLHIEEVESPMISHFGIYKAAASDTVSYIRIRRFYKDVFRDFMKGLEIQRSVDSKLDKLIIDLRDNPGGVVDETTKILNQLINEKDKLLLSTKNNLNNPKEYVSNGRSFLDVDRVVILCNENSASASEILAGVLQDYDRAVLVGRKTFGKGLIQQNYKLVNDGSLNLSIGEYILPGGRSIYGGSDTSGSAYVSLENERPFKNVKGVDVDITVEKCDIAQQSSKLTTQIVVENQLWSEDLENIDLTEAILSNIPSEDTASCDQYLQKQVAWQIYSLMKPNGSIINSLHADSMINRAIDVITSNEYQEILGYRN